MAGDVVKVEGLAELREALLSLPAKLRRQALRTALAAGARAFRDEARRLAPVLSAPVIRKGKVIRNPGTLRKAISVRTSKVARANGDVGVFVNVKPAPGAKFKTTKKNFLGLRYKVREQTRLSQRGADSPTDPYYWRWQEFGTKNMPARPFLRPAAEAMQAEALRRIEKTLGPAIQKLNTKRNTAA